MSASPTCAAHVAAPLRKLCRFHFPWPKPTVVAICCSRWTTCSRVKACCVCFPIQKSGVWWGRCVSLAWSCLMARTGHPSSCVAAIVRVMPLRKGSILDAGIVSCRYIASRETLMLQRNAAKAKVKAARSTMWSYCEPRRWRRISRR